MSSRKCRLLGVDVDGTLLSGGVLDDADVVALHSAGEAGIRICLCTGRTFNEVLPIWRRLRLPGPHCPIICVGGALVVEPATGRTLYSRPFERNTADQLSRAMRREGYPVMCLVDAWREEFDYFMIGRCDGHPLYQRFFEARRPRLRWVDGLDAAAGPRALRISLLDDGGRADELVAKYRREFAGRIEIQAIWLGRTCAYIVESFSARAHKLSALMYVGQALGVGPGAMAAVGDDHNDLAMLRGVGFSGAPADADAEVLAAADCALPPRGQRPVAEFVARLLDGH